MTTGSRDVVIIGGGIVGCLSGYLLGRQGFKVTILEADSLPLGMAVELECPHDPAVHFCGSLCCAFDCRKSYRQYLSVSLHLSSSVPTLVSWASRGGAKSGRRTNGEGFFH